jgi:2'-5' RNA ligase
MRLFVALDIDDAIQQKLDDYIRVLAPRLPGVRFVRSNNYHVTLKFLGEVKSAQEVIERLRAVQHAPVEINVRGVGFFPNAHAPRVFWAGIEAPTVAGLARKVDATLSGMGFAAEKEFHPHLTLARNGSGRPRPVRGERPPEAFAQLSQIVASSAAPEFGTMTAHDFYLYESRLAAGGANYAKLERFALTGRTPEVDAR